MDFLITYELKARELESVVILKLLLEKKGYSVMLYPWFNESEELRRLIRKNKPKVYIISATYNEENFYSFVTNVCGYVNKVINLRWEQVFPIGLENLPFDYKLAAFYPSGIVKDIVHVCWGEEEKKQLIARGVNDNKAVVVGHMGMDFLRPEFADLLYTRDYFSHKYNLDISKKWLLFISSFTAFDDSERTLEEYGKIGFREFVPFCLESRKIILNWISKLLKQHKELIFIYRPHPAEERLASELNELQQVFPNFKVISDYPVKHWIKNVDQIYNWYSTSEADIYFLNKRSFVLRPVKIPDFLEVKILTASPFIENYDDFLLSIDKCDVKLSDNENGFNCNALVHSYYANDMYGEPAYKKAVALFEKVYHSEDLNIVYPIRYILKTQLAFFVFKIKRIIQDNLVLNNFLHKIIFKKRYRIYMENRMYSENRLREGKQRNVATQEEIDTLSKRMEKILFDGTEQI